MQSESCIAKVLYTFLVKKDTESCILGISIKIWVFGVFVYFPIQNFEKILPSTSSLVISPVIEPR